MLKSVREESFVVFGLGTFGSNCARTLYRSGAIVLAVDQEEKVVDQVSQQVTVAVLSALAVRLALFGGTFDPPHVGHLVTAVNVRHDLRLDRLGRPSFVLAGIVVGASAPLIGTFLVQKRLEEELREFDGETYVMERSLVPDVALVKADVADKSGNLRFRLTARNFNPAAAMAGKICIVEVEEVVEIGAIDPDHVHLPGIYIDRIVHNPTPEKRIEQRTVRAAGAQ